LTLVGIGFLLFSPLTKPYAALLYQTMRHIADGWSCYELPRRGKGGSGSHMSVEFEMNLRPLKGSGGLKGLGRNHFTE
jgi:hypothetical protein